MRRPRWRPIVRLLAVAAGDRAFEYLLHRRWRPVVRLLAVAAFVAAALPSAGGAAQAQTLPSLSVADVTVAENVMGGKATVTVTLSATSTDDVTVDYETSTEMGDTATEDTDYKAVDDELTITAGTMSGTVEVEITDDSLDEANETFTFTLSSPTNATISDSTATVTITDNDDAPKLSVADVSVAENVMGGEVSVTVSLSEVSGRAVTVSYATSTEMGDTATADTDYAATTSGSLTIAAGSSSGTAKVAITDDTLDEDDETFTFTLSSPTNATIKDMEGSATVTITDNDAAPSLSVADVTVKEGVGSATLTVSLSAASGKTVTVGYATSSPTTTDAATAGTDYTAKSGTLTISAGDDEGTVSVTLASDTVDEDDEKFTFTLSSPTNATISDSSATVTIEDNPALSVADVTVDEDDGTATLTVSMDAEGAADVTVKYKTTDGSATAGSDYVAKSLSTLTIAKGDRSGTVSVSITDDTTDEHEEQFTFTLSVPSNASIKAMSGEATVKITDNDDPPELSVADVTVKEGAGTADLEVELSAASGKTVTVSYATSNGTAMAGSDYTSKTGSLTFTPGQTSQTVEVTLASDTVDEANETFTFTLSSPGNATFPSMSTTTSATVTIQDNPALSVANVTVNEDVGNATLTVLLDTEGAADVTVSYATSNGTATAGTNSDYTAVSSSLTIDAGETSGTVSVPIRDDTTDEHSETFTFTLSSPSNASIKAMSGAATVTITDNDDPPELSVEAVTVAEGAGTANLEVKLSEVSGKTVTVSYATANGTATAGTNGDYTSKTGSLTFTPGDESKTVSVTILEDLTDEHDETFTFTLTVDANSNATLGTASSATVTIIDNDPPPSMNVTGGGTVAEATGSVTLTVSLSLASGKTVTVDYATANGTATAPDDYTAVSDTFTFTPGDESKTVSVSIISDTEDEDDETFTFTLTNAENATLGTSSATITIGDNPALSVADVEVNEDAGNAVFTVSLDMVGSFQLTVDYATSDGTAKAPGDYSVTSGRLTFPAGTGALDVEVPIGDDSNQELAEDFVFTLSNPMNASISVASAEGLIHDNESPVLARAVPSVFAVFEVRLSAASGRDVSVDYATTDGTAIAGVNYIERAGMLTIPAGERRRHDPGADRRRHDRWREPVVQLAVEQSPERGSAQRAGDRRDHDP